MAGLGSVAPFSFSLAFWDSEREGAADSEFGLDPNFTPEILQYLFDDCKPHTGATVFVAPVQALEDDKNLVVILSINADAVVYDREFPSVGQLSAKNLDLERLTCFRVFEGIPNQVLEHLEQW